MKRFLAVLCLLLAPSLALAQSGVQTDQNGHPIGTFTAVGIGTSVNHGGVSLDMGSVKDSMLLPKGTTGQRPSGIAGMLRYNSTTSQLETFVGGAWSSIVAPVPNAGGTAQDAINALFVSSLGPVGPVVAPCTGGGAEQALVSASATATAQHSSILFGGVSQPCQLNNQWLMPRDGFVSLFAWGGGAIDFNTARGNGGSASQYILVNTQTVAQNAPGAMAIDMNGIRQFDLNGVNLWGSSLSEPQALVANSVQIGTCCASNNLTAINSSFGNTSAVFGTPLDGNFNPILAGGIYSGTLAAGGTGYVDGTYNKVALTGGTGTNAFADQIVVSGGVVTSVLIRDGNGITYPGSSYVVNDVLSAGNADLGGSGSGFQFTVTGLTKKTPTTANTLPRFLGVQFSDIGTCVICNNSSDIMLWNFQMSGGAGVGIMPVFGGGGGDIGPGRMEFYRKPIWFGGPNGSGINSSRIHDITFDFTGQNYDTAYRTGNRSSIEIDSGKGYSISNIMVYRSPATDPFIKLGGTGANSKLGDIIITGANMPSVFSPGSQNSCVEINNGGDGTVPDNVIITALDCNPGNDAAAVKYNAFPTHFIEDTIASAHFTSSTLTGLGEYWDHTGRPWGISSTTNNTPPSADATMDLGNDVKGLIVPVGTTGQRPTGHNGMVRYNSTTATPEAFANSAWSSLLASTDATISATGSMTLTNGLIVNWGPWTSAGSQAAVAVTYNTAFTSATYAVLSSCASASTTSAQTWYDTPANSGVNLRSQVGSLSCTYMAIGK